MIAKLKYFLFIVLAVLTAYSFNSCNLFLVAVRNVPTFFTPPKPVLNKIKKPVRDSVDISVLWIGHSTMLIQMYDKLIITDPILTETVGEFARRVYDPGIDIENIPKCDLILISHSHFDHLSFGSLEILEGINPHSALLFPEGLEDHIPAYSFNMIRMKNNNGYQYGYIGETREISGMKVTTVFASHWGGRYGVDGYLWADNAYTGYIVEYRGKTIYFAGDTGYDEKTFKQIGARFNIDVAMIPIGPCADCEQCGTKNHVFPPDAVMIFKDIKANYMIPMHYGTLHFAQADPEQPVIALRKIMQADTTLTGIEIMKIGEQKFFYGSGSERPVK